MRRNSLFCQKKSDGKLHGDLNQHGILWIYLRTYCADDYAGSPTCRMCRDVIVGDCRRGGWKISEHSFRRNRGVHEMDLARVFAFGGGSGCAPGDSPHGNATPGWLISDHPGKAYRDFKERPSARFSGCALPYGRGTADPGRLFIISTTPRAFVLCYLI